MGINIGTKLFPVGMLRGEDWIGYSGKDVLVNCGNNRRVVRAQLIYRLDPYVVRRQNLGDEEVYQLRQPTRVRWTVRRFAGDVVGAVVSRDCREKSAALGRGKTRAPSGVLRIRLHRPEIADPGIGKMQRSQQRKGSGGVDSRRRHCQGPWEGFKADGNGL